jgi:hypothetical protein
MRAMRHTILENATSASQGRFKADSRMRTADWFRKAPLEKNEKELSSDWTPVRQDPHLSNTKDLLTAYHFLNVNKGLTSPAYPIL